MQNPSSFIWVELLLLFALITIGSSLGGGLVQLMGNWTGLDYNSLVQSIDKTAPLTEKNIVRVSIMIGQVCTFVLPALLFAWMITQKNRFLEVGFKNTLPFKQLGWSVLLILVSFPFVQWLFWVNKQVALPDWAVEQEALVNQTIFSLLKVNHPYELFFNIIAIGLLPAIGEELIFRGIIQRKLQEWWQQPHLAIWVTAIIFSSIHFQFQGFLPRVFLGGLLGYLFFWSKNLWLPVIAHFFYNVSQVLIQYLYYTGFQTAFNLENLQEITTLLTISSFMAILLIGYFLYKSPDY